MIELTVQRNIRAQTNELVCHFLDEDRLRQMDRAEFQRFLREKMQAFGDEIMAAWEARYGDRLTGR